MLGRFTTHSIMVYLISMLLIISIATPEIFAYGRYDQMQLNTTIEALVLSNGPVTKLDETSDHSSFLIKFNNGMSIKLPCDFGRHYYKKVNTCVSTSKMVMIYDHCQVIVFVIRTSQKLPQNFFTRVSISLYNYMINSSDTS